MSLNPNQWVKLVAQNRAKAIFVSWTEAEMEELKKSNFSQEVADRLRGVNTSATTKEPEAINEEVQGQGEEKVEAPAVDPDNEEKEEEPIKETKKVKKTKTKK